MIPPNDVVLELHAFSPKCVLGQLTSLELAPFSLRLHKGDLAVLSAPTATAMASLVSALSLMKAEYVGSYHFCGSEVVSLSDAARARCRAEHIGVFSPEVPLIEDLTVSENLEIPLRYAGIRAGLDQRISVISDEFELSGVGGLYPNQLTEQQRLKVLLSRAYVAGPRLVISVASSFAQFEDILRARERTDSTASAALLVLVPRGLEVGSSSIRVILSANGG